MKTIFLLATSLAIGHEELFRSAADLLTAGDYKASEKLYHELRLGEGSGWSYAIAALNESYSLFYMKRPQKALTLIHELERYSLPPLLQREIRVLEARSLTAMARGGWEGMDCVLQQMAVESARQALEADCLLQREKGQSHCISNKRLIALEAWTRNQFALLARAREENFFSPHTKEEAIWRLKLFTIAVKQKMKLWQKVADQKLYSSYGSMYEKEIKRWVPFFESLSTHKGFSEQPLSLYKLILQAVREGDAQKALSTIADLSKVSEKEGRAITGEIAPTEQLALEVGMALKTIPIQMAAIQLLLKSASEKGKKLSQSERETLQSSLLTIKKAQQALRHGDELLAHLLLSSVAHTLSDPKMATGEEILSLLEQAIREQLYTARLTALLASRETSLGSKQELLLNNQRAVLKVLKRFEQAVIEREEREFHSSPGRCQKNPWEQALPPFYRGYQLSYGVAKSLEKGKMRLIQLWDHQMAAVEEWRSSAEALQIQDNGSCYGGGGNNELKELLQRIQVMESQDRVEQSQATTIEEEKPW